MILLSGRNRLAVAFLVSAAVVVLSCSFGGGRAGAQSTAPTDSAARARQAAKDWALKIFDEIGQKPNEDRRVTFQPLDDRDVASSRHRRRLYGWLLSALHERGRVWKYSVMNPMDSRHVAEALKQAGVQDWRGVYVRTLQKHSLTKLNLSCPAILDGNRIKLECTAVNIDTHKAWGRATAVFDMDWLGAPLAWEQALDAVAGDVVAGLRGSGRVGEIKIVDYQTGRDTPLAKSIARGLRVRVARQNAQRRGAFSLGGSAKEEEAKHRLEGAIEHWDDKLVLSVMVYLNDETVNAVEEHIALSSISKRLLESGPVDPKKPKDGDAADKYALLQAVEGGDIDGLKAALEAGLDVNARDRRSWTPLMHAAAKGYTLMVDLLLQAEADLGMRAVDGATALYLASANGHLEIVGILARAGADPSTMGPGGKTPRNVADEHGHARIVGLLEAVEHERAVAVERQREQDLGLSHSDRLAVEWGLASAGFDVAPADGRFEKNTRAALRAWQQAEGFNVTGYLTRAQAEVMIATGKQAERERAERERAERERLAREVAERERARLAREAAERARMEEEELRSLERLGFQLEDPEFSGSHDGKDYSSPLCTIHGTDGACDLNAWILVRNREERDTCGDMDAVSYRGKCINGKLHGLTLLDTPWEWRFGYFWRGRPVYPFVHASSPDLIGITKEDQSYGCVLFRVVKYGDEVIEPWDKSGTKEDCPMVQREFGFSMDQEFAEALSEGKIELERLERHFHDRLYKAR